jgi:hypothetical protein
MNKKHVVRLTSEERIELETLTSTGEASARKLTRARVLLLSDQGGGTQGSRSESRRRHRPKKHGVSRRS